MDLSASDMSSDSSDASLSAESTSADSIEQDFLFMSEPEDPAEMAAAIDSDEFDSDSDVSMSAETEDEEDGDQPASIIMVNQNVQALNPLTHVELPSKNSDASKKRKFSDSIELPNGQARNGLVDEVRKRLKPDNASQNYRNSDGNLLLDKSNLPAEIWHHVFTFCAPKTLGRLLQVSKCFRVYLEPSSSGISIAPLSISAARFLSPDNIWRISRQNINLHGLPAPLSGKSELDMWKLFCGSTCQFCGRRAESSVKTDQWHHGPGKNGIAPIWSFGIRACGSCLQKKSTKEIDLLLSSSIASPLMAALPFVFLNNELHALSSDALQSGQRPPSMQVTKYFSNDQVDDIKKEFEEVKAMGSATAEEWLKGLDRRGHDRRNDAARWERWEFNGGIERIRCLHKLQPPTSALPQAPLATTLPKTASLPPHPGHNVQFSSHHLSHLPVPVKTCFATNPPPRFDSPAQIGFANFPPRPQAQAKHERTKEEVAEMRAARRADIERRCLLLDPPITAGVLAHMPSFQAAIQIIQPLVENSWEVLKMRLLAQREDAEQRENDRLAQTRVAQERIVERRFHDLQSRSDSKDLVEREWDDMQTPLRARIGGYADEIIRDVWNGGEKVSYETSPLFAVEVLIYVRRRFYAEIAKDEAVIRATGREPDPEPSNAPFTWKLILENMKWIFDTKIKPYTEQYRKELFLCNACEYASKYYGFEGVIQHYAAKHTSALSVGSVVVHWKAEWPEITPFHPEPNKIAAKTDYSAAPSASVPYMSTGSLPQNYGYGGYSTSVPTPIQAPNMHGYQESPGSYYGHQQSGDQYSGHQNGHYPPPPLQYQNQSQTYQPPQYPVTSQPAIVPGYDGSQGYPQNGYGAQYQPSQQDMYVTPHPVGTYLSAAPEISGQQAPYVSSVGQHGSYSQPPSYNTNDIAQAPPKSEKYMAQLHDLARNAREIWNSIGSIKEVPGSLKVHTIIYHLLNRYREIYQESPPLSMMVDGLSSSKDMRPVRNINGLLCKACILGMAGSVAIPQKKHFSFPQLVNHFYSIHEVGASQSNYGHVPDWTKDMVDLPDLPKLKAVVNAPGMDDQKLALFTEALPEIVGVPEPLARDLYHDTRTQYAEYDASNKYQHLAPSQDNHDKYYSVAHDRVSVSGTLNIDNGEYDPKRPGDLLVEPRPPRTVQGQHQNFREREFLIDNQSAYHRQRYEDEQHDRIIQECHSRSVAEQRPSSSSQAAPSAEYSRVITQQEPAVEMERRSRYYDSSDVENRVRRDARVLTYEEPELVFSGREGRTANSMSYHSNGRDQSPVTVHNNLPEDAQVRLRDDIAVQQNRIYDVVAQISQQAQRVKKQQPIIVEAIDDGSEDGEVRMESNSNALPPQNLLPDEASSAAERFLSNFRPGDDSAGNVNDLGAGRRGDESHSQWEGERGENARMCPVPVEPQRRVRDKLEDHRGRGNSRRPVNTAEDLGKYTVRERTPAPRPILAPAYEERYTSAVPQETRRNRSPELVDRRYKLNNVVYRDERQSSQGNYRTPSRYARYESVRLENDRARSRSPLYIKLGAHPGQYREMSTVPHPTHALRPEPMLRSRTPQQGAEDVAFERPHRQEYYRIYADDPRTREPHYAEAYEFVRVSDPQGDYMIRRPVRREPEPVYDTYEDDIYRQPIYGSLAPPAASRTEPMFYEEEYDPHHPAPPMPASRQVRYQ